ncbi:DMT family transporter [Cellulomonas sp. ATA003]|uniref:DMT family transporter n=1 Tax=Cellulomonas sp. ATA003 TaxID=3073064 RepID=UPI002872C4BE|nr:DMT family transporter [Cellulomonas sp. ATA003]WNB85688.1 DMT family transporter [Cellulomonas sp. ATA003]
MVAVVVAAVLFAVNGTVAKLAMTSGLGPTRLVELRTLGSALVLVPVAVLVVRRRMALRRREVLVMAALGIVGMAAVQWFYLVAISRLPVGLALLIEYTAPLLIALWARFVLHELVRPRAWWGLAASLVGLTMVAQVRRGVELDAVGLAAAAGAAVALATYYLLGERLVATRDPLSTQAWSLAFAALFWVVLQPLWTFDATVLATTTDLPGPLTGTTTPTWALVAWVVVLGTVVPYTLVLVGVQVIGAARAGLLGMIEPVAAAGAAWLVLGESMTGLQVAGGVVVVAGVALAETARVRPAVVVPEPVVTEPVVTEPVVTEPVERITSPTLP